MKKKIVLIISCIKKRCILIFQYIYFFIGGVGFSKTFFFKFNNSCKFSFNIDN